MKKILKSQIGIQKPDGAFLQREIDLTFEDIAGGVFEVEITGESPLKGYKFVIKQSELKRARDAGRVVGQ